MIYKGIRIETHRGLDSEASADAPEGKQFKSTGLTQVVCGVIGGDKASLARCVASVKRDIDEGFEDHTGESEEE